MIKKFWITPAGNAINTQTIPHSYILNGKERILTDGGEFISVNIGERDKPRAGNFTFTAINRKLEYIFNEVPEGQSEKRSQDAIELFWKNHPLTTINGKPHKNTVDGQFDIIDYTKQDVDQITSWNEIYAVASIINEMPFEKKRDVAYFYGQSPVGKTNDDLKLLLAQFNGGLCTSEKERATFLRTWKSENVGDRDLTVSVRKAIALDVIEQRSSENGKVNYYFGQEFIGIEFTDVLAYCKREEQLYKTIIRLVNERDGYKEEAKKSNSQDNLLNNVKATGLNTNEAFDLREEAKKLKSEGFIDKLTGVHNMTVLKLLPIVEGARRAKEDARNAALAGVV